MRTSQTVAEVPLVVDEDMVVEPCHASVQSKQFASARSHHRFMLLLGVVVVATSFLLTFQGSGTEASLKLGSFELPPLCTSRTWFGVECPGCGLTRSFVALAGGQITESLQYHRLGWLMALAVVSQIPYRAYRLARPQMTDVAWWLAVGFGYLLVAALIVNWLLLQFSI